MFIFLHLEGARLSTLPFRPVVPGTDDHMYSEVYTSVILPRQTRVAHIPASSHLSRSRDGWPTLGGWAKKCLRRRWRSKSHSRRSRRVHDRKCEQLYHYEKHLQLYCVRFSMHKTTVFVLVTSDGCLLENEQWLATQELVNKWFTALKK